MSRVLRLLKINHIIGRYRLDQFADTDLLPTLPRVALKLSPWRLYPVPVALGWLAQE